MRAAVIADTHLPRGQRQMPAECLTRLADADLIVHAGDFTVVTLLDSLAALGPPVVAVHGNCDDAELRRRLPSRAIVDLDGIPIGLIHDAGPAKGRLTRMRSAFSGCAAVVFGHSHIPLYERAPDGFVIFNPGSPTDRRRQPAHTMGLVTVRGGLHLEHVILD